MLNGINKAQGKTQKNTATGAVTANTSLFDKNILGNLKTARTKFIEYARMHFPQSVVNKDTGKEIGISRNGIDKFLSRNILYEKYASGFHIPELVQNATKIGEAVNYHRDNPSILSYEYYDSPISIDGAQYMAHIRVRNTNSGD